MIRTVMTMIFTRVMMRAVELGRNDWDFKSPITSCQWSICQELLIHYGGYKYKKIETSRPVS